MREEGWQAQQSTCGRLWLPTKRWAKAAEATAVCSAPRDRQDGERPQCCRKKKKAGRKPKKTLPQGFAQPTWQEFGLGLPAWPLGGPTAAGAADEAGQTGCGEAAGRLRAADLLEQT